MVAPYFKVLLFAFNLYGIQKMNPEALNKIAHQWIDAFNRHDLEGLLTLYDDQAEHYSPKLKMRLPQTNGLIKGKNELRAWWKDSFDRLPSLHYEVIQLTPFQNRIFMEYLRHVMGKDDLRVGEMLEVRNELIVFSRVYHS